MISKDKVKQLVASGIEGTEIVLVNIQVSTSNQIKILLDSFDGVTIDKCVEISRLVEGNLDREQEDFELEVSSYGIGQPFIIPLHFLKNINRVVEVNLNDGRTVKGTLKLVKLGEDKEQVISIEILNKKKIKLEGKKKKVEQDEITEIDGNQILKAKLVPIF